ncbi:MAG: class I SAM-dependent methyltransferase [Candidatus Kapaibacteriota bacterium]
MSAYDADFYKQRTDSLRAAYQIVPYIIKLLKPKSVVDVGCGTGEFLYVFEEMGVSDYLGIDGDWVLRQRMRIPKEKFIPMNLEEPRKLSRTYDLAISLEVAEHLSSEAAERFVKFLVSLSDYVLFSAAIPFQGGLNHINEQWPDYWFKLFGKHNFTPIDIVRKQFWNNEEVVYWYSQNTFLYIKNELISNNLHLLENKVDDSYINVVHPKLFLKKAQELEKIHRTIPSFVWKIKSFIKRHNRQAQ